MNSKIIRASIWNVVGTFLLKSISLIAVPIFTRLMTQEDYGYVSTFTSYISFMGIVIGLNLNTSIFNARVDFGNRFNEFISSITKASMVIFCGILIFANSIFQLIREPLGLERLYMNIIIVTSFAEYILNSYYKINTVNFEYRKNITISVLNSLFNLGLSVILIILLDNDVLGKMVGQSVFVCGVAIFLYYALSYKRANFFDIEDVRYALKIGIPNIFHQTLHLIMSQSDRIMILNMIDASSAAKYSVVYTYALIIQMLWGAINEVWVPWLYRKLKVGEFDKIIKYSKYYVSAFTVLSILCMLIMPDFMFILAPENYSDSKDLIAVVIVATFFLYLYSFYVNIELYHKRNQYTAFATLIAATVNIVGNAVLIPTYGYKVAAYTTLGSYVILMLVHHIITGRILKINIYTPTFFIPYLLMVCVMGVVTNIFLDVLYIRWSILALMMICFVYLVRKNWVTIRAAIHEIREKGDQQ